MTNWVRGHSWQRASLALILVYALSIKLALAPFALAAPAVGEAGYAGIICHNGNGAASQDGPAQQDRHCDECCLARILVALDGPPIPSAPFAFERPVAWIGSEITYAAAVAGPPVEAWSPLQAQRGPPIS